MTAPHRTARPTIVCDYNGRPLPRAASKHKIPFIYERPREQHSGSAAWTIARAPGTGAAPGQWKFLIPVVSIREGVDVDGSEVHIPPREVGLCGHVAEPGAADRQIEDEVERRMDLGGVRPRGLGGVGSWEGSAPGRGQLLGGVGSWEGSAPGRGRLLGGVGSWEGSAPGGVGSWEGSDRVCAVERCWSSVGAIPTRQLGRSSR